MCLPNIQTRQNQPRCLDGNLAAHLVAPRSVILDTASYPIIFIARSSNPYPLSFGGLHGDPMRSPKKTACAAALAKITQKHRREFDTKTKTEIIERAKDEMGRIRCEGLSYRSPERCYAVVRKGEFQIDHIVAEWSVTDKKKKLKASDGQILCEVCYGIKNPKDTTEYAKNNRMKAKNLGAAAQPKQSIPQKPKPEKAPPKPLPPKRGGIFAQYGYLEPKK